MNRTLLLAPLVVVALGCGADFGPDRTVRSASLQFEGSVLSLFEDRTLTPFFLNETGDVLENVDGIVWTSSNPAVAAIDQQGHVRGVALGGPVTISVRAHGKTAAAIIDVVPERVVLSENPSSLVLGHTLHLSGTAVDFNGDPISTSAAPVRWSSGDVTIATVDELTGVVTAVGAGDVFIYARAAGRTSGLHLETGDPSVYDGHWAGESPCANCTYPTTFPITFDVFFGRVKTFKITVTGPPPFTQCGAGGEPTLLAPPTGAPNAVVRDDRFSFTLIPEVTTVAGTFTSTTSMTGMYSAMSIPVVCRQNLLPVPALSIAAGGFTATRQ